MPDLDLHTERPSVYLDQWAWIDLARAAGGNPKRPGDASALAALRLAAAEGVAFPLSRVHYYETTKIKDPKQRRDLARVMASVSYFRTLRGGRELMRHQILNAMHEVFGRPTFRPSQPEPIGLGAVFAFTGKQRLLSLRQRDTGRETTDEDLPGADTLRRKLAQLAETMLIAGPADDEVATLREHGYRPEVPQATAASRVDWEETYKGMLRDDPVTASELRVRVMARELCHEHLVVFNDALREYRLSLDRALGLASEGSRSSRAKMMQLCDRIPTMRLAVDMKTALFRNSERTWLLNDIYDIDAVSLAIPYCHVVVTDKDAMDRVRRSKGSERNRTALVSSFDELLERLPDLTAAAQRMPGDPTGWDAVGPGKGFVASLPDGSWPMLGSQRRR